MKRHRLDLGSGMSVETYRDWNGRVYIASTGRASMMFNDLKSLRRFLRLPAKTASREKLDAWLAGLDPVVDHETPVGDPQELQATGFGPEHHGDSDPTENTRMIT